MCGCVGCGGDVAHVGIGNVGLEEGGVPFSGDSGVESEEGSDNCLVV